MAVCTLPAIDGFLVVGFWADVHCLVVGVSVVDVSLEDSESAEVVWVKSTGISYRIMDSFRFVKL